MEISPYASEMRNTLKTLDKSNKIELLNFVENEDFYILHFSINSYPVKLTTDFNTYCYFESELLDVKELNCVFMDNETKTTENIIKKINQHLKNLVDNTTESKEHKILEDKFHIYQKIEEISKALINYELVEKESKTFRDSKTSVDINKFPKELLFNPNQIYQIIIQEMKKINKNTSYKHYLEPINNNPYSLKFICFLNNKDFNNDTLEMKINLEPKLYPFFPPRIEIVKPAIKLPLVHNLMNLKLLKLENWNPTLSLEWLLTNLVNQIEPIAHEYIKTDSKFPELEILLVKLASITKEYSSDKELIILEAPKVNITSLDSSSESGANKFWKSGVGYGNDARKAWDISSFIKEQEIINYELSNILKQICSIVSEDSIEELFSSSLPTFLINRIKGLTLLELEKSKDVYNEIFNILDKMTRIDKVNKKFISEIGNAFSVISDEIMSLFSSRPETQEDETYIKIHCVSDWFKTRTVTDEILPTNSITINKKQEYEEFMKKLQFGSYEIPTSHRFREYISQKPEQKAILRMISEVSTFKTGLPLNWESTVWVRVSKSSMNVFSFFISGPKDTPYENGIFEFHAAFPTNYPNSEPKVLINTTGGGSIRFNPNLYNCGKVCLSLLGTWSGQEGEKWNPKNSTFLQVLVSIQSLILVENPYFNEPGWEREMHTTLGQSKSKSYNEPLLVGTIKWAINDMLKNPPNGMEEVIKNHFKFKKEEIINTTQKWLNEISSGYRAELEKARNEMVSLFESL
jgi:ubiquitin-protein ligase